MGQSPSFSTMFRGEKMFDKKINNNSVFVGIYHIYLRTVDELG